MLLRASALALLLLTACTTTPPTPIPLPSTTATTLPSGLVYEDRKVGDGDEAKAGTTVLVHYTGWLQADGTQFDTSRSRGQPFQFQLGKGSVIKGWEDGVPGMKVGGQRRLFIPPQLGYGDRGAGDAIPPKADLVFDVELVEVR